MVCVSGGFIYVWYPRGTKADAIASIVVGIVPVSYTHLNYNGSDVWVEDLEKGILKTNVKLSQAFVEQFSTRIANMVSQQFNDVNNILEAETDTLRISIIHPSVTNTGYSISIRKTPAVMRLTEKGMVESGYCTQEILNLLKNCIKAKMNRCV